MGSPASPRLAPLLLARRTRLAATVLDVEVGLLAVVGAFGAVLHIDGGLDGSAYAAVYVCLALASAFSAPLASLVVASLAMGLEVGVRTVTAAPGSFSPTSLLPHFGFMTVFTCRASCCWREIARCQPGHETLWPPRCERLRDDALSYRLLGAPQGEAASPQKSCDDERLARSPASRRSTSRCTSPAPPARLARLHTAMLPLAERRRTHLRVSESAPAQNLCDGRSWPTRASSAPPQPPHRCCASPASSHYSSLLRPAVPGALRTRLPVFGTAPCAACSSRPRRGPRAERARAGAGRGRLPLRGRAIQNEASSCSWSGPRPRQGKLYRAARRSGGATPRARSSTPAVRSAREVTAVDYPPPSPSSTTRTASTRIRAVSGDAPPAVGQALPPQRRAGLDGPREPPLAALPREYDENARWSSPAAWRRRPCEHRGAAAHRPRPAAGQRWCVGSRRRGVFNDAARSTLEVLASPMASRSPSPDAARLEGAGHHGWSYRPAEQARHAEVAEAEAPPPRAASPALSVISPTSITSRTSTTPTATTSAT